MPSAGPPASVLVTVTEPRLVFVNVQVIESPGSACTVTAVLVSCASPSAEQSIPVRSQPAGTVSVVV